MSVDLLAFQARASSMAPPPNILIKAPHLRLKNEREKNIYKKLKGKTFIHTPALDIELLRVTGMDAELDRIFGIVEWIFLEHY